jgi:hypothetical protein
MRTLLYPAIALVLRMLIPAEFTDLLPLDALDQDNSLAAFAAFGLPPCVVQSMAQYPHRSMRTPVAIALRSIVNVLGRNTSIGFYDGSYLDPRPMKD